MQFRLVTIALAGLVASVSAATGSTNITHGNNTFPGNATNGTTPGTPPPTDVGSGAYQHVVSCGLLGAVVVGGLTLVL